MILFVSTLITDDKPKFSLNYVRGNLRNNDKLDIFKYSLASLAVAYNWSKVILKISLDDTYKSQQSELEEFIRTEFSRFNLILEWQRNEYQNDWKRDYELLDNNLIWYYCNHDHIFFDSSQDYLSSLVENIKDKKLCTLIFSHFPECIRTARQGYVSPPSSSPTPFPTYTIQNNYISFDLQVCSSIQIITKELYYQWWFEGEFNHVKLPRPDYFGISLPELKPIPSSEIITPLKEICRHFDGYQHIQPAITNNQCPSIDIPLGFFENNIRIRYGYDDYKEGWTNINPKNDYYYAYNKSGTDYKFTLEDLPLVWKGRISEINSNSNIDREEMIQYRLKSILEMIYTSEYYIIDKEVEEKILNEYLKNYPEYQII